MATKAWKVKFKAAEKITSIKIQGKIMSCEYLSKIMSCVQYFTI